MLKVFKVFQNKYFLKYTYQNVFQIQIQNTFSKCISITKYKIQICILNTYFKYLYLKYCPELYLTYIASNNNIKCDTIIFTMTLW